MYIHILGPSGSGTTTLGRALQEKLGFLHLDADDYFWMPTNPKYQEKRPIEERQRLLRKDMSTAKNCVITGSFTGWGDVFIPLFDLVVYLWVPTDIRISRLKAREAQNFGQEIEPDGRMYENHQEFLRWAAQYDQGGLDMRSKATHELWLSTLPCPVMRIEGEVTLEYSLGQVEREISKWIDANLTQ